MILKYHYSKHLNYTRDKICIERLSITKKEVEFKLMPVSFKNIGKNVKKVFTRPEIYLLN